MRKVLKQININNLNFIPTVKYWNIKTKNNITNILKFGWASINKLIKSKSKNAIFFPLILYPNKIILFLKFNKTENIIIINGFKNSDGWNEYPKKFNHRVEPLFFVLIKSKVIIKKILIVKPI